MTKEEARWVWRMIDTSGQRTVNANSANPLSEQKKNDLSPRSTELSQTNIIHIGKMADAQKTPFVRELASSGRLAFE